jgi:hypothetical protein
LKLLKITGPNLGGLLCHPQKDTVPGQLLIVLSWTTVIVWELLLLITKATLQVSELLTYVTILLGHMTDPLGKVLNLLLINNKTAPLLCNDALSVMLQLKQALGIMCHVRPTTVVVDSI